MAKVIKFSEAVLKPGDIGIEIPVLGVESIVQDVIIEVGTEVGLSCDDSVAA